MTYLFYAKNEDGSKICSYMFSENFLFLVNNFQKVTNNVEFSDGIRE